MGGAGIPRGGAGSAPPAAPQHAPATRRHRLTSETAHSEAQGSTLASAHPLSAGDSDSNLMLHVSGSASAQAHSMASERREVASVADTPTKIKTTGKERSDSGTAQAGGPGTINATTPCHTVAREGTRRTSLAVTRSGDEQDLAPPSDSDPTLNQGPARA